MLREIFKNLLAPRHLNWENDNRIFVVEELLPHLDLQQKIIQVIRWAYGYDGSDHSYEHASDGSTIVPDRTLNGMIKEPAGVTHDYVNRVKDHTTPDGHKWTATESNWLYYDILRACGYSKLLAGFRFSLLEATILFWWKR